MRTRWIEHNKRALIILGAAVAIVTLVSLPSVGGGYFSDDPIYVSTNDELKSIPLTEIWRIFLGRPNGYREYAPIRDISYRLDMAFYGDSAAGYHITNIILYALVCVAAWAAARKLFERFIPDGGEAGAAALAAAVIYAFHPAHLESVAWIAGRKDILSALFLFLSTATLLVSLEGDTLGRGMFAASLALFACALLSKAAASSFAAFAAVLVSAADARRGAAIARAIKRGIILGLPFLALSALGLWLNMQDRPQILSVKELSSMSLTAKAIVSLKILGTLCKISLIPFNLRILYGINKTGIEGVVLIATGAACAALGLRAAVRALRAPSAWSLGAVLFAVLALPYLQIIPFNAFALASERFVFSASFGIAVVAGAALAARPRLLKYALPALVIASLAITVPRALQWRDPLHTLIPDNLKYEPGNHELVMREIQIDLAPAKRYDEARALAKTVTYTKMSNFLSYYVTALETLDNGGAANCKRSIDTLKNMVNRQSSEDLLNTMGKLSECAGDDFSAAKYYYMAQKAALTTNINIGGKHRAVLERHNIELDQLKRLAESSLSNLSLRMNYAGRLMELYALADAELEYRAILSQLSDDRRRAVVIYNLGLIALRDSRFGEAAEDIRSAISLGFNTDQAYNNLGSAEKASARFKEAEDAYRTAMALNTLAYEPAYNLGRMFQSTDRRDAARKAFEEGLRRARAAGGDVKLFEFELEHLNENPGYYDR